MEAPTIAAPPRTQGARTPNFQKGGKTPSPWEKTAQHSNRTRGKEKRESWGKEKQEYSKKEKHRTRGKKDHRTRPRPTNAVAGAVFRKTQHHPRPAHCVQLLAVVSPPRARAVRRERAAGATQNPAAGIAPAGRGDLKVFISPPTRLARSLACRCVCPIYSGAGLPLTPHCPRDTTPTVAGGRPGRGGVREDLPSLLLGGCAFVAQASGRPPRSLRLGDTTGSWGVPWESVLRLNFHLPISPLPSPTGGNSE